MWPPTASNSSRSFVHPGPLSGHDPQAACQLDGLEARRKQRFEPFGGDEPGFHREGLLEARAFRQGPAHGLKLVHHRFHVGFSGQGCDEGDRLGRPHRLTVALFYQDA